MQFRVVSIIFRKEVLDMLRDKRTLVAMIGVPLVLYPALFVFGSQAAMMQMDKMQAAKSRIAIVGNDAQLVSEWLAEDERIAVTSSDMPLVDLQQGALQAVVELPPDLKANLDTGATAKIVVQFDAAEIPSMEASKRVGDILNERFEKLLADRLVKEGLPENFAKPLELETKNVATATKSTGAMLGMLMPLIMIVMVGVGAFYPAIDLTAGEKERGTFETLLSTPALSLEILAGKFLTVFCIAMLTGLMNLGSMVATLGFQLSQMEEEMFEFSLRFPTENIVVVFLAMVPLAFFISAAMMTVAVLARNFREAQNLLTPILLVIIFPAAVAAIPGARLTAGMQIVPIANLALLFKDLMVDAATPQAIAVVLASTTLYACLALLVAARLFQREEVVLSVEHGLPLTLQRSHYRPLSLPTPGIALFILTVCLLLLFYAGTYLQSTYGLIGVAATQWLLFLAPTLLILWYVRVDLRNALSLRAPSLLALAGGLIMAAGWIVITLQLSVWQQRVWPMPDGLAEEMAKMLRLDEAPVLLLIAVLAVSPAICEEILFRGAVMSGLRKHVPVWALLLLVGIAFGVAHLSLQRMTLTAVSGVMLTYMAWRTGSIFPGMIAHFIVNAVSVFIDTEYVPAAVSEITEKALTQQMGFPVWILAVAVVVFIAGVVCVEMTTRPAMKGRSEE